MNVLTLKADIVNLPVFLRFLTQFLKERPFSLQRRKEIEIAAEEAFVNIIRYAYKFDKPGDLQLSFHETANKRVEIEFRDRGVPFDPTSMTEPDTELSISERKIGGLGVLFIRRMVDGLSYRRQGDQNILTFSILMPEGDIANTRGKTEAS